MKVELGQSYYLKQGNAVYRVYDITGDSKNTPNQDGRIIYLVVSSKLGWFSTNDRFITITERKFWDFFTSDY